MAANQDRPADMPAGQAETVEIRDLPASEEELNAEQMEEVHGGGALTTSGATVCWIQTTRVDSCWIENNDPAKVIRPGGTG